MKDTVATKIADTLKRTGNTITEFSKNNDGEKKFFEGASQDAIPKIEIKDGLILMPDGRYIGVIELYPLNYYRKTPEQKAKILNSFDTVFKSNVGKFGIKMVSDYSDAGPISQNLRANCPNQNEPKIKRLLEEYITYIKQLCASGTSVSRYFFLWEYFGDGSEMSKDYKQIYAEMNTNRADFMEYFANCGNPCRQYKSREDATRGTAEFLYYYFNRQTSKAESFDERIQRVNKDFANFNRKHGTDKKPTWNDYIAPKGLYFVNRDCLYIDGWFQSYIGISGNKWPRAVYGGWLDSFRCGSNVDIDVIGKKIPRTATLFAMKGINESIERRHKWSVEHGKDEKADALKQRFKNNTAIYDVMKHQGDNLYNVAVVLTLRTQTYEDMNTLRKRMMGHINRRMELGCEASYLCVEDYFALTMPFLTITPVFRRLSHNVLSSNLSSFYMATYFQTNSPDGFVVGRNPDENSVVVLDCFDRTIHENGNMSIIGTSGAGKTFFEQIIGRRMFLNGARVFYIIPKKGRHDYYDGCQSVGGTFVKLAPGSRDCINIMEIRPEKNIDLSNLGEDSKQDNSSWRAKKIINLKTWLNMILKNTSNTRIGTADGKLEKALRKIYDRYGITDDNASIYDANGRIKKMPVLGDLYNEICKDKELAHITSALEAFVHGSSSNMNGQTNVDLNDARYVVFDVDEDDIEEELFPAYLYIAFDYAYCEVKKNQKSNDLVIMDEVWKMMIVEEAAKQVFNMVKLIRGYHGATVIATQEIKDFFKSAGDYGDAILSNSAISIYLRLKELELELVSNKMNIKGEKLKSLEQLGTPERKHHALISMGSDYIVSSIKPTDEEVMTFTPDEG